MPTYVYENTITGKEIEITMTMTQMQHRQRKNGTIKLKGGAIGKRIHTVASTTASGGWPLCSLAAGVHPSQVSEMQRKAEAKGVPTEFDKKTGDAVFRNRKHRTKFCKAFGYKDRDGGYGDAT